MSFYINKSIYLFSIVTSQTLKQVFPIKNQRKAINYFIQVCKGVEYLHSKGLLYGAFDVNQIYINKNKVTLGLKHLYDLNKNEAQTNFN